MAPLAELDIRSGDVHQGVWGLIHGQIPTTVLTRQSARPRPRVWLSSSILTMLESQTFFAWINCSFTVELYGWETGTR